MVVGAQTGVPLMTFKSYTIFVPVTLDRAS
jgi:hypothetical protein